MNKDVRANSLKIILPYYLLIFCINSEMTSLEPLSSLFFARPFIHAHLIYWQNIYFVKAILWWVWVENNDDPCTADRTMIKVKTNMTLNSIGPRLNTWFTYQFNFDLSCHSNLKTRKAHELKVNYNGETFFFIHYLLSKGTFWTIKKNILLMCLTSKIFHKNWITCSAK